MDEEYDVALIAVEATEEEALLLLHWENALRSDGRFDNSAIDAELLVWDDQWAWFRKLDHCDCFFLGVGNRRVGFIRATYAEGNFHLAVLVSIPWLGHGVGLSGIRLYSHWLRQKYPSHRILAQVVACHHSSRKAFAKAGFVETVQGEEFITLRFTG